MRIDPHGARASEAGDLAGQQFRAFVAVLTQARAAAADLPEAQGRAGAAALSAELCQLIELHTLEAGRQSGTGGADAESQARFLKAALADEVLLHTGWAGRAHWRHVLVEATLLGTAHAGQQVFVQIDQLLRERDPARRAVARLYLYVLALGFRGRYRGDPAPVALATYRRELFQFAYQRAPDLHAGAAVLSEQAYASTLSYGAGQRVSRLSRRGLTVGLMLLFLLVLSEALWVWQSWPLRRALNATIVTALAPRGHAAGATGGEA